MQVAQRKSVNVFGKKDRKRTKPRRQAFHARAGATIKAEIADAFTKSAPGGVGDVVAGNAADRAPQQDPRKTILTKKMAVRQHAGDQQRDISFNHYQEQNAVETVLTDEVVEKTELHESVTRQLSVVSRQLFYFSLTTATDQFAASSSCGGFTTRTGHEA